MLQNVLQFFEFLGVNPVWPIITSVLSLILVGVSDKKLEYKVEEVEKDSKKEYRIFKYK